MRSTTITRTQIAFAPLLILLLLSTYTTSANKHFLDNDTLAIAETTEASPVHHGGIKVFQFDWENISSIAPITLWIFCAMLAKIVFHVTPKLHHIFPESCLLIVIGILIGVIIYLTEAAIVNELPTKTFLFIMLPPIMLDAGYFMPSRLFFGNLGTILLFAVVGTLWNAFTIGFSLWGLSNFDMFGVQLELMEILLFSTLISAVDPVAVIAVFEEIQVNDILYITVFGESLLNDAVTIVLYHMFEEYAVMGQDNITGTEIVKGALSFPVVALGGTLIGILWGVMTGYLTKFSYKVLAVEPIFVFILAYLSYLNAELFHMSGVLAIIFCGIVMKKYVEANIAPNSSITVKYALKTLSSASETIIFMLLGVSTVSGEHVWNTWFVLATIVFCTVFRFVGVLWMSALANKFRLHKLTGVDQFVIGYGGLRGAVSFALVLLIQESAVKDEQVRRMFLTTVIAVIFVTVFLQGTTVKPFVTWLNVEKSDKKDLKMNERIQTQLMDHTLNAVETIIGKFGQNRYRDIIKHVDETYIMPYLIRDYKGSAHKKLMETYTKLEYAEFSCPSKSRMQTTTQIRFDTEVTGSTELTVEPRAPESTAVPIADLNTDDIFLPKSRSRKTSYSRHSLQANDLVIEPIISQSNLLSRRPKRKVGVPFFSAIPHESYFNRGFETDDLAGAPRSAALAPVEEHMRETAGRPSMYPNRSAPNSVASGPLATSYL